ncbi:MAG TPA: nuclear transport factor 2 family protein [Opitutaceae bacterium]
MATRLPPPLWLIVALVWALTTVGCTEQSKALLPPSAQAEENRRLVLAFHDAFFNRRDVDAAARYVAPEYREHDPRLAGGRQALVDYFRQDFARNPHRSTRVVRSAVDNDIVFLHLEVKSAPDAHGEAAVEMYRVHEGRIVEHWRVAQPVPVNSANTNTMF